MESYETELEGDIVSLGFWLNKNDPEFKGCKFLRWLVLTVLILCSQVLIWLEILGELTKRINNISEAYKMKQGDIAEDFDKFDGSLLENFEELYALEINKDKVYIRRMITKLMVGYILSLFLTRGLGERS